MASDLSIDSQFSDETNERFREIWHAQVEAGAIVPWTCTIKPLEAPAISSMGGHTDDGDEWALNTMDDSGWDQVVVGMEARFFIAGIEEYRGTVAWVERQRLPTDDH